MKMISLSVVISTKNLDGRNGVASCFQANLISVYNIITVASVFHGIVGNARYQHAFDILTLSHHLVWRYIQIDIGYTSRSPVVLIDGTLNCNHYIFFALRPVVLPFNQALWNAMFLKDNAWPPVAGIIWTFLDTGNIPLLTWTTRSPDLSSIKK